MKSIVERHAALAMKERLFVIFTILIKTVFVRDKMSFGSKACMNYSISKKVVAGGRSGLAGGKRLLKPGE
ncbi:hypothetical protein GCM10011325_11970 [Dyadobacter sediminis]|nr:hypothetical protein GCM10011325_11970 [Dyadobacter sediminis]